MGEHTEPDDAHADEPVGDDASEQRLLVGDRREQTALFVGNPLGVTRIDVAAAQVGQFSLIERGPVRCLGTDGTTLVLASETDVSVHADGEFVPLGFGPADAVGVDESWFYAADTDRIARLDRSSCDTKGRVFPDWETVGSVSTPRRFDGNRLATADGLVRIGAEVESLGLEDVRDVSGPLVATAEGVTRRTETGWTVVQPGDATAVLAESRAHAIVDDQLYARGATTWEPISLPGESPPVGIAGGSTLAVLTADGTVHVATEPEETSDGYDGWRSQAVGLTDVVSFVALSESVGVRTVTRRPDRTREG